MSDKVKNHIWRNGIMGLVVGDALGVPVQFMTREEIRNRKEGPVKGMESGGVYDMPQGTWSDDSSMALCTLDSILEFGLLDPVEVMLKFIRWEIKGEYTPFGEAFDEGNTCSGAIYDFIGKPDIETCGRTGEYANGNGALMRILPACLYYAERQSGFKADMIKEAIAGIDEVSALTHNHLRSKMACGIYYFILNEILYALGRYEEVISTYEQRIADAYPNELVLGTPLEMPGLKDLIQKGIDAALRYYGADPKNHTEMCHFGRLFSMDEFEQIPKDDIISSGYVVTSLEVAIWCLIKTDSYKECMLLAVNLGDDTDTIAAIAGGIAGMYYGYESIPEDWLACIPRRAWIEDMCDRADAGITGLDNHISDLHMHVIPNVDDGSESMEMSMEMLRSSYLQGVRRVFCTPHGGVFCRDGCKDIERSFEELVGRGAAEMPDMQLYFGAEVRMLPTEMENIISMLDKRIMPTLADSEYVLAEYMNGFLITYEDIMDSIKKLKESGYIPIVAHVERYYTVIPDIEAARKLHDMGCYFQINAFSIAEESNPAIRKRTEELLEAGIVDFIGSDAHRTNHRPPMLIRGVKELYKKYDKDYVDKMVYRNAEELILVK